MDVAEFCPLATVRSLTNSVSIMFGVLGDGNLSLLSPLDEGMFALKCSPRNSGVNPDQEK